MCLCLCMGAEVSLTVLLPLHTWLQKEMFSGEIQILDKAQLQIWTLFFLWTEHEKNKKNALHSCTGAATAADAEDLQALFGARTWWLGPAGGDKRPRLWPPSAPSWGTPQALILPCQPLSTPAHYTTSWETSGVYLGTKMGQYLCGMRNNNNALWEYCAGAEKGGGLFIRNKSSAVLPASVENLRWYFSFTFCRLKGWSAESAEHLRQSIISLDVYRKCHIAGVSHMFSSCSW